MAFNCWRIQACGHQMQAARAHVVILVGVLAEVRRKCCVEGRMQPCVLLCEHARRSRSNKPDAVER